MDAPNPPRPIVAAAILHPDGKRFLAARRTYPPTVAGQWEFPGGKAEPGESLEQALLREVQEELGVSVQLLPDEILPEPRPHGWAGWPLATGKPMRVFPARLAPGSTPEQIRLTEGHDALVWCALDPAASESGGEGHTGQGPLSLPWIPADEPIVRALLRWARSRQR